MSDASPATKPRIERTGLEPAVLMSMSDAEVMARIAPPLRPAPHHPRGNEQHDEDANR
jgi:hypothetical protein